MKNIICFGDSNTYGYNPNTNGRYDSNIRWTGIMQNILYEYKIIEEGYNSRTIIFKDNYDEKNCAIDYLPKCLKKYSNFDLIIIMLGLNDFQTVFNPAVKSVLYGMNVLIDIVKEFSLDNLSNLLILPPVNVGINVENSEFGCMFNRFSVIKIYEFSQKLKSLCLNRGIQFFDVNKIIKPCLEDSVHISIDDNKILGENLASIVTRIVK
jgi:lysophospholipase L1-like esterase